MSGAADPVQDTAQDVANLRLPVPFFDLLMVLLVTCLVFVAPLPDGETMQAMDVSIAQGKAKTVQPSDVIAVTPTRAAQGWTFAVQGETGIIAPDALARRAAAEGRKVVLIVPPTTALQDFVTMQSTLSEMDVPFALAIKHKD